MFATESLPCAFVCEENMNCDGISILPSEHVGIVGHHGAVPFYLISRVKGKRVGFVCMCKMQFKLTSGSDLKIACVCVCVFLNCKLKCVCATIFIRLKRRLWV